MSGIDSLLERIRSLSRSEHDKGARFEDLMARWLVTDDLQKLQYKKVQHYADWAEEQGETQKDLGIDLVASLHEETGFVAIQCKCYQPDHVVQSNDMDKFLSASSKEKFCRRLFIDTTTKDWGANIQKKIKDQKPPLIRITLHDLRKSDVVWEKIDPFQNRNDLLVKEKKELYPYQNKVLQDVVDGFKKNDRGKLLMACGTGKTFVALKIAEKIAGKGKRVLFLVPSLSLVSQSMREWANESNTALRVFVVCSDQTVGNKKRRGEADDVVEDIRDLAFPVTTNASKLAKVAKTENPNKMTVVFSTYQSLDKIACSQQEGLQDFDLIICDEAHWTTGMSDKAKADTEKGSNFTDIHRENYVKGTKRLYMTATPRVYGMKTKMRSKKEDKNLYDMGKEEFYGKVFSTYSFSDAVKAERLTDYEVIVLQLDEESVKPFAQEWLKKEGEDTLKIDDVTKLVGCYKALTKINIEKVENNIPMQKTIAFCRDIKSSKKLMEKFPSIVKDYCELPEYVNAKKYGCNIQHVDGKDSAKKRDNSLHWLRSNASEEECRILTNARCLTEGIDVPSLDAIIFMHPRKSPIDIVQSVGRVMRKMEGKNKGYVILPIVVPSGSSPEQSLKNNITYKVVWQVVNALKSHDNRLKSNINQAEVNDNIFDKIRFFSVTSEIPRQSSKPPLDVGGGSSGSEQDNADDQRKLDIRELPLDSEAVKAIRPIIVEKCGDRSYWKRWGEEISKIVKNQTEKLKLDIDADKTKKVEFVRFLREIRDDLNDQITEDEAIEMLSQHLVTEPAFKALFDKGDDFVEMNSVSKSMKGIVERIYSVELQKNAKGVLGEFYDDIRSRTIDLKTTSDEESRRKSMEIKQKLVSQLYDDFFRNAFPTMSDKLGIVYTPVEVVDFILHSINDLLKKEFSTNLGSKGVHIIDPFTGTGTFVTRLLQGGLIEKPQMRYKYENEIHANEILLLAYYIASINIETAFQGIMGGSYAPFKGICLTDTFAMYGKDDMIAEIMPDNSERRKRQKSLGIKVIMGNPPYRIGQKSVGDNAQNTYYPALDQKIRGTYVKESNAKLTRSSYDSYVKAIRWASDRLGDDGGIVSFIINNGWIDSRSLDGMRRCLEKECGSIYIVNLRGNIRTKMKENDFSLEGGNIFGQGSMVGVAIAFFVKKQNKLSNGQVYYYDIGEDEGGKFDTDRKLAFLRKTKSVKSLSERFSKIQADQYGDWINKRESKNFPTYIEIGNKKLEEKLFKNFTLGVVTNRDPWCYNSSKDKLEENIKKLVNEYNSELAQYQHGTSKAKSYFAVGANSIPFTSKLKNDFKAGKLLSVTDGHFAISSYRPFCKQWVFFSRRLNERTNQNFCVFPDTYSSNRTINVASGNHSVYQFSVYMVDTLSDLNCLSAGAQCFPLKLYNEKNGKDDENSLLNVTYRQRSKDGITNHGLRHFQKFYNSKKISKEDIFYYTYAILHSNDYRKKYANNLNKESPRIPTVGQLKDFWSFAKSGRDLGDLHVNYENAEMYNATFAKGSLNTHGDAKDYFRVAKMQFGNNGKKSDKTTIHYNRNITIKGIPSQAYEYVISGKSAIEWVMSRQCESSSKIKSKASVVITNDANDYANETMGNPAYPLELLLRIITVSLRTLAIVENLPKIKEHEH